MANTVLITSVTGIVVSGVVGPTATAWAARRAARKQFIRDQAAKRREDLRTLLDEAASLLGVAVIRLRELGEAGGSGATTEAQRAWADQVYTIGQRLQLRLGSSDAVVAKYQSVRSALGDVGEAAPDSEEYQSAVQEFETARDTFLKAAQTKLDRVISDKEPR